MSTSPEVTLTGTVFDTGGNPLAGATVVLTLVNYASVPPVVTGTGIFASTVLQTTTANDGTFSVGPFYGNFQIAPTSTFYTLSILLNGHSSSGIESSYQFLNAGTYDLSSATPYTNYTNPVTGPNNVIYNDAVVPTGTINGTTGSDGNAVFTLPHVPFPVESVLLFKNGLLQVRGTAYTLSGNTITYLAGHIPVSGDVHIASYRYNSLANFTPEAVTALSTVAVTGSYTDLLNVPTLTNTVFGRHGTVTAQTNDYSIGQISGAATVATSGSYNDLLNLPVFQTETPAGSYPGTTYSIAHTPRKLLGLYLNGQLLYPSVDYTLVGTTLTLSNATSGSDLLHAIYVY